MDYQEMNKEELMEIILKQQSEMSKLKEEKAALKVKAELEGKFGVYRDFIGEEKLNRELCYARERKDGLVVTFIDFDNLKYVNDNFGHSEGNEYLTGIVDIMKQNIREKDFIFKYGGDEFVVVFLGTTLSKVKKAWDRVLAAISGLNRNSDYSKSISYGFAEYSCEINENITGEELIKIADANMYKCKRAKKEEIKGTMNN